MSLSLWCACDGVRLVSWICDRVCGVHVAVSMLVNASLNVSVLVVDNAHGRDMVWDGEQRIGRDPRYLRKCWSRPSVKGATKVIESG